MLLSRRLLSSPVLSFSFRRFFFFLPTQVPWHFSVNFVRGRKFLYVLVTKKSRYHHLDTSYCLAMVRLRSVSDRYVHGSEKVVDRTDSGALVYWRRTLVCLGLCQGSVPTATSKTETLYITSSEIPNNLWTYEIARREWILPFTRG